MAIPIKENLDLARADTTCFKCLSMEYVSVSKMISTDISFLSA